MFNQIKKFIPYILILIVVVGFFTFNANAQTPLPSNTIPSANQSSINTAPATSTQTTSLSVDPHCVDRNGNRVAKTEAECKTDNPGGRWNGTNATGLAQPPTVNDDRSSALARFLANECGITSLDGLSACLLGIIYWIFNGIGSFLLWVAGYFFNAIIAITLLDTSLYSQTFLTEAWAVVRDLSNIFFILILLYVAIQMILGLGGGHGAGPQKIITQVIIMSLLINFSMFATKVVIDTSNIIAVVFYNKLAIETKITRTDGSKVERDYTKATGRVNEKDLSGAMMAAFNPTKLLSEDFLKQAKSVPTMGTTVNEDVPFTMLLALIILSGIIMAFGAYAFFIAGASFLGRMIELWVLIIFSPFAFMSSSISVLSGIPTIGWGAWFSRLISASFMAPMFMFFMYFIFKLIAVNPFSGMIAAKDDSVGIIGTILLILIPSLVILSLLLKATEYAKKGSGQFGEMALGAVKGIGALAIGGGALGLAAIGRTAIGKTAAKLSRNDDAIKYGRDYRKAQISYNQELENWKKNGRQGNKPILQKPDTGTDKFFKDLAIRIGGNINANQLKKGDVSHARHEMDDLKKKVGAEGVTDLNLSGIQKQVMKETYIKDNRSQLEGDIKRGSDAKGNIIYEVDGDGHDILDGNGNKKRFSESIYKTNNRDRVEDELRTTEGIPPGQTFTDAQKKKVDDLLNTAYNDKVREMVEGLGKHKFEHLQAEAKENMTPGARMSAGSTGGTYDVRNLANMGTHKLDGLGTKATIGLLAVVATGIRTGLKQGLKIDAGKPQRDVWKDIGEVLSNSFKNLNIKIDSSGHGGGKDDHGSGAVHDTHGGGGHH